MKYRNLLIHTLAFGAGTKTVKELDGIAARAAALGASGLELLFHPMPVLPAKQVGAGYKRHGLTRASLCVFYPGNLSCGDPTTTAGHPMAFKHAQRAVDYVRRLQDAGIDIDVIDGPLNIVLGRPAPSYGRESFGATVDFGRNLADIL